MHEQEIADFLLSLLRRDQDPSGIEVVKSPQKLFQLYISDALINSNDAEATTTQNAYTRLKETVTLRDGVLRIKFKMKRTGASGSVRGRIYKNGAALGTERANTSATYIEYSEDLQYQAGDLIQIYAYSILADTVHIADFRIYASKTLNLMENTLT